MTVISPGVTESELADSISDESAREAMKDFRRRAISPDSVAQAIAFAIEQPLDVDLNEIIVRPTARISLWVPGSLVDQIAPAPTPSLCASICRITFTSPQGIFESFR